VYVSSSDSPRVPPEPLSPSPAAATATVGDVPAFSEVLRSLGHDLDAGEQEMTMAIRATAGRSDLDPRALIALQVGVYRYGDAIDLASQLVDRATSAIKTVLQGSGQ
jgi:hypothetical protein